MPQDQNLAKWWAQLGGRTRALGAHGGALVSGSWGLEEGGLGVGEHQRTVGISPGRLKSKGAHRGIVASWRWWRRRTVVDGGGVPDDMLHDKTHHSSGRPAGSNKRCH